MKKASYKIIVRIHIYRKINTYMIANTKIIWKNVLMIANSNFWLERMHVRGKFIEKFAYIFLCLTMHT